ncbi:DUF805 domain-containing protein [Marinomonas sp.]
MPLTKNRTFIHRRGLVMNFYIEAWRRGFDFSGRSRREAFWMFMLIHSVISIGCIAWDIKSDQLSWLDALYSVVSFIPMLAAMIRRLQDAGKSTVWLFIFLVPAIGPFWLAYQLAQPSELVSAKGVAL